MQCRQNGCDGTFYTAPHVFDSIFTTHAFVGSAMFHLVFTLLPKRDTYIRLFNLLQEICRRHNQTLSPTSVSLDFECASRNTVVETFPSAELKSCLFHYCKAIWKKTQEWGLLIDYKDLQEENILVRRATALPLPPLDKGEDYWLHTRENAPRQRGLCQTDILCNKDMDRRQIIPHLLGITTRLRYPESSTI